MPVIVRELIIKARVSGENNTKGRKPGNKTPSTRQVEAGLEEAIRLIKNRNER